MSQIYQDLVNIRNLLSGPDKWTQRAAAVNVEGFHRLPTDEDACRWCLLGAFQKVRAAQETYYVMYNALGGAVWAFNDADRTTYQDVVDFLDGLIIKHAKA
jgi:hypothetical protein